jgi:hypothetical protein
MPQPTVSISTPTGNTAIPCTASGNAQPVSGDTLVAMGYQIDTGPINPISHFIPAGGAWSFTLTVTDCPVVGTNYLLTVYAGDSSGTFNTDSVNFVRTS